MSELLERFETYIDKTDSCWLWNGTLFKQGYARFTFKSKRI